MCSIQTMVTPPAWISRIVPISSAHSASVRPPAISSSSRSRGGSPARAPAPAVCGRAASACRPAGWPWPAAGLLEHVDAAARRPRACSAEGRGDQQVLGDGQPPERMRDLERAADAGPAARGAGLRVMSRPRAGRCRIGADATGDQIERVVLPAPFGPICRAPRPGRRQGDVVRDLQRPEGLGSRRASAPSCGGSSPNEDHSLCIGAPARTRRC